MASELPEAACAAWLLERQDALQAEADRLIDRGFGIIQIKTHIGIVGVQVDNFPQADLCPTVWRRRGTTKMGRRTPRTIHLCPRSTSLAGLAA